MSEIAIKTQLASIEYGHGNDSVVLLHGLFGQARNLSSLAKYLASSYKVYAFDLPSHGDSPDMPVEMTIPAMARQLFRAMTELGIGKSNLFGHSLGGKVAMAFALQYPASVSSMVIADIAPVLYPPQHLGIIDALLKLKIGQLRSREDADQQLSAAIPDIATRQFLLQNLVKHSEGYRWKMNLEVIAKYYKNLRAGISLAADAKPFEGPVCFIGGSESDYIKREYAAATQALFPNATYREIAGAGHWLHAEKPAIFNPLVDRFFSSCQLR